jgi:DNA-binding CsgD family transcriptional regulator
MSYAARHPDRVTHLVLYGCYTRGRLARDLTPNQIEETEAKLKLTALGWGRDSPVFRQLYTSLWIPEATAEQSRAFNDLIRTSPTPENVAQLMRTAFRLDLRDVAPQVCCPTLVLHATGDLVAPFDEGRSLAGLVPGATFVPITSRNHLLLETEPAWQQLVDALDGFLPTSPPTAAAIAPLADDLSRREHEVLELVAQGLDNATIAGRLGISEKTVRNQVSIILSKLGVNSRAKAIVRARDAGFGRRTAGEKSDGERFR